MQIKIDNALARFGVSGPGRDWILRALNPAGEHKSPGLPDQSATPVLRPDYRVQRTISAPFGAATWDAFLWCPPGDVNTLFWATAPAGADFGAVAPPVGAEYGVLRLQPGSASAFSANNPITYTGSGADLTAYTSLPVVDAHSFRHQFKSITVTLVASAISDQGQVYAAQFAPMWTQGGMSSLSRPYVYSPQINVVGAAYRTTLPTDETQLCAMSPGFYMDAAREGVYVPCHLSGPTQPFARSDVCSSTLFTDDAPTFTGSYTTPVDLRPYQFGCLAYANANAISGQPWVFSRAFGTTPTNGIADLSGADQPPRLDTGYDNTSIPVIIFRGLAGSSGGGLASSLQVKVIAGLEIVPNPTAPDRVYCEPAATYEPRALEAYYAMCMELRQAYPSSYNSFEDILNAIGSVASKVWSVVEKPLREVAPMLIHGAANALMKGAMLTGARRGVARGGAAGGGVRRVLYAPPTVERSASLASRGSARSASTRISKRAPRAMVTGARRGRRR